MFIRIAVADDNKTLLEYFSNIISNEPDFILAGVCRNGEEVIELYSRQKFDVILMDIEMEQRNDGIIATRKLMDIDSSIKVIMLTIHEDIDTILNAYEAGAVDYLIKRCSVVTVVEAIKDAYHNQSPIRPKIAEKLRKKISSIKEVQDSLIYIIEKVSSLTPAERSILNLLAEGKTLKEVSKNRNIELATVKTHVSSILKKFDKTRTGDVISIIDKFNLKRFLEDY